MFCYNCGHKNRDEASFCCGCGSKLSENKQDGSDCYEIEDLIKAGAMVKEIPPEKGDVAISLNCPYCNSPVDGKFCHRCKKNIDFQVEVSSGINCPGCGINLPPQIASCPACGSKL